MEFKIISRPQLTYSMPLFSDSLNILGVFGIDENIKQLIATYDEMIYGEFVYDDCVSIHKSDIMCEYNNRVYIVLKYGGKTTLYEIIEKKLVEIHDYGFKINGEVKAIILTSRYPKLHVTSKHKLFPSYDMYNIMLMQSMRDKNIMSEYIAACDYGLRATTSVHWPILKKHTNSEGVCVVLICNEQINNDITYVYKSCPEDMKHEDYNNMLYVTDNYIYNYSRSHNKIFIFSIDTKNMLREYSILYNPEELVVKIIVKDMYIFMLTYNNQNMYIHVLEARTGTKINTVCVLTINAKYTITMPNFVITNKYIYVYYIIKSKRSLCPHIMTLKRKSYFIDK